MSLRPSVTNRAVDLPPPYRLVTLREAGDAFEHACAMAPEAGAGTLVWVRRFDVAEFAVVLEPTANAVEHSDPRLAGRQPRTEDDLRASVA